MLLTITTSVIRSSASRPKAATRSSHEGDSRGRWACGFTAVRRRGVRARAAAVAGAGVATAVSVAGTAPSVLRCVRVRDWLSPFFDPSSSSSRVPITVPTQSVTLSARLAVGSGAVRLAVRSAGRRSKRRGVSCVGGGIG